MGGAAAAVAAPVVEAVQSVVQPVSSVATDIAKSVVGVVPQAFQLGGDVLDTAKNVAKKTGDVVVNAGETVGQVATNIVKNPLPVIETVALTAAGLPPDASSALVTYANGGSLKDAAVAYGAVNVGQAAADKFAAPATYGTDVGSQQSQMLTAQEAATKEIGAMPSVEKSAISGAASGATKALASGQSIGEGALKGAIVGGGSEYASEAAGMQPGSTGEFLTKTLAGGTLSNIVSGSKSAPYLPTGSAPSTSVTTTGAGTTPGSAALAQALRTDLGAPIFGGDKDKQSPKSGWNVESLRYMGGTGEA